jgi:hypothetical protein
MGKNNKTRLGQPAEIAKLDFHDWLGRLIDRTKAKTTEINKGMLMWDQIQNRFGFTIEDYLTRNKFRRKKEVNDAKIMLKKSRRPTIFSNLSKDNIRNLSKPIKWRHKMTEEKQEQIEKSEEETEKKDESSGGKESEEKE